MRQEYIQLGKGIQHAAAHQAHRGITGLLRITQRVDHEEILHALSAGWIEVGQKQRQPQPFCAFVDRPEFFFVQIFAEYVLRDKHRLHARELRHALQFADCKRHVLHGQNDAAIKFVRVFFMRGHTGIVVYRCQLCSKAGRRPVHQGVGHRQRIGIALALLHVRDDVVETGHGLAHDRGLRAIRHRQHHGIAVLVLPHLRAVRRPLLDHQVHKLLRIPMHVRVNHARVTARRRS